MQLDNAANTLHIGLPGSRHKSKLKEKKILRIKGGKKSFDAGGQCLPGFKSFLLP